MKVDWKGIYPAITTKFTDDDKLDLPAFEKNITVQLEAGINGVILGGTLGEASSLSEEEKSELVKATVEMVDGKIPVILNIAEQTTKGAIEQAKLAKENGASGLMMLPPMRYKATDKETVTYFKEIARSTDLPIMIYNNPVDYKIMVSLDMFEELAEEANIKAVKDSTREVTTVTKMINRFGDRFKILGGIDTLALEYMMMGAVGWVGGLVCAFPRETVAIYKLVQAKRYEEAIEIYRWFMPLLELDLSPQLVQNIKLAELKTGLGTENVRAPRLPLSGRERERVLKIIQEGLDNRPELPDYLNL
ncbi:dihydrodipicolinate synthase family protein [Flexithrix dorotheae]|uniref:dihydrodipicolinate synthase family protein n=1 Tax=Flexithrix dorotheae TaxID=70993 RepID=UPI000370AACF|nr:dihydrodipicolinate synthase family protein [Flexithrix dorotheae]